MGRAFKGLCRPLRRNQTLLFVIVAFGPTLGLAAASGYWLFYRAAYVIGGLAPICFVWARANLRRLEVTVERPADRLQVGQRAEARGRISSGAVSPPAPPGVPPGAPCGLSRFTRSYGASHPLLVFPLPEELPYFGAPPAQLPGEGTVRRRTHYVTPNAAAIRDYH